MPSQAVKEFVPGSTWKMTSPVVLSTAVLGPYVPMFPAWVTVAVVSGPPFFSTVTVTATVAKVTVAVPVMVTVWVW